MRKVTNIAHMKTADFNTIKNRKKKLKERMIRVIDRSSMPVCEKIFTKQQMKSIMDEIAKIYEIHGV